MAGRLIKIKILKIPQSFQSTPECEECQIRLLHLMKQMCTKKMGEERHGCFSETGKEYL